jgi:enoyl-[acyl-carrier-protein] reductase (NADH)
MAHLAEPRMKNGDSLFTTIYENYNGHGRHPAALESAVRCQAAELSPEGIRHRRIRRTAREGQGQVAVAF